MGAWPALGVRGDVILGAVKRAPRRARAAAQLGRAHGHRVGCAHPGATFSGSMGRMAPRPAARQQRVCGRAQSDQDDEAGDGLRHSAATNRI